MTDHTSSLVIERFKRLPRRSGECWQGGLVRLPLWVDGGARGRPYRPWGALWVSRATGLAHLKMAPEQDTRDWTLALEALLEFGLKRNLAGCRPGSLEVLDEDLGTRLRHALGDMALGLTVLPDLPAVKHVLTELAQGAGRGPLPPAALGAPGVTADRMRAFAEAATRFYEAAP